MIGTNFLIKFYTSLLKIKSNVSDVDVFELWYER